MTNKDDWGMSLEEIAQIKDKIRRELNQVPNKAAILTRDENNEPLAIVFDPKVLGVGKGGTIIER